MSCVWNSPTRRSVVRTNAVKSSVLASFVVANAQIVVASSYTLNSLSRYSTAVSSIVNSLSSSVCFTFANAPTTLASSYELNSLTSRLAAFASRSKRFSSECFKVEDAQAVLLRPCGLNSPACSCAARANVVNS
eukprot:gnl/TRDRNA2_/TRDRNA2_174592_c9_seq28.p1 gnl/TRDRNA2_/TRDRNA2_174592_c9~~gnl/TRDRNA2_/TRDRNA2_174592_c9_seq28.p1  ORF type:complete len:134 (-),score=12.21 gnl/TRDRNA2_/TRDRNA2_174592_c9_seq28:46-447(-)